ncbi:ATP-binding cassette domain-containing protein, partial [Pseudomonas sp. SIMBA_059]
SLLRGDSDRQSREQARELLTLLGLGERLHHLPAQLSGGEQQRVALARGLVIQPEILLLDEPLGALDASTRKQVQQELKTLQRELGITFLLVTHSQSEALMLSDRVVVMNKGQIEQV